MLFEEWFEEEVKDKLSYATIAFHNNKADLEAAFDAGKALGEKEAFKAGFEHAIDIGTQIEQEQEFDDFPENLVEVMVKNGYVA